MLVRCRFWGILGPPSYGIGATIRIGREIQCLPYTGFLMHFLFILNDLSRNENKLRCERGVG